MSSQTATPLNELNEQTPGLDLAKAESKFRKHFWNREYAQAATALERRIEATLEFSTSIGAWYLLWIGYCYELDGNQEAAHRLYNRSHKAHREIPPIPTITSNADGHVSEQAKKVSDQLIQGIQGNLSLPQNFDTELDALSGNQSTPKMERALELLGTYLGFYSERPDNEIGTGPDVLWITPDGESLCIELKAEKKDNSVYTKDDLGQLRDHQTWVRNSRDTTNVIPLFVGPILPSSPQSNPDDNMMIVELSQFRSIRDSLRDALADICNTATPSTVVSVTHESMSQKKLNWPHIFHAIKKTALKDID